jgi:TrmH family RNA methyltransferase
MRVPFSHRSWEAMTPLLEGYETIALADAGGDVVYDQVTWAGSSALIVGGEAFGPTPAAWSVATHRVAIPLHHGVESLNAGVAGSLLLFEAARQRRAAGSAR